MKVFPMESMWQTLTLSDLQLSQWRGQSVLYRSIGGSLRTWRSGSWLLGWAEPIGAMLVAIVFALAPFVSTSLVGVLLAACGGFWLLLTLSDEGKWGFTPIHLLVLLYWGIATVATAMSPVKNAAMVGWAKLTLFLLLFALCARVLRSPRLRSALISLYLHIATIVSVYGLRQWFFKAEALATWTDPTSQMAGVTRVYSYLGNPNLLAAYLIPAVLLAVAAAFAWRGWLPKALAVTMVLVNSACLVLTFSRGGWIGLVAGGFVLVLLLVYWWSVKLPSRFQKWAIPATLGTSAVVLLLAIALVEPVRMRVASIFAGREDSSNNFRMNVWMAALDMVRDRPILGIGPGNTAFNQVYPLYMRPKYSALSAYSVPLEIAVETGFIGLFAFLWLLLVTLNFGIRQLQRLREMESCEGYWLIAIIATVCGLWAHGLVDTVLYRPEVSTLWWLSIALIASYYPQRESVSDAIDSENPFPPFTDR
ncbi:MAG: IctB family putative bicarbonate transporter [Geitlerinemataceae cyanobacterium]